MNSLLSIKLVKVTLFERYIDSNESKAKWENEIETPFWNKNRPWMHKYS